MINNISALQCLTLFIALRYVYCISNPLNSGCTKLIQTGNAIIISTLTPSCTNSVALSITTTITFAYTKKDREYQIMMSIINLQQTNVGVRYPHYIISNKIQSSMLVNWAIQYGCTTRYLRIRYLIKQSSFKELYMQTSIICPTGANINYQSSNVASCGSSTLTTANRTITPNISIINNSTFSPNYIYQLVATIFSIQFSTTHLQSDLLISMEEILFSFSSINLRIKMLCNTCYYQFVKICLNFLIFSKQQIKLKYYNFQITKGFYNGQSVFNEKIQNNNLFYAISSFQINGGAGGVNFNITTIQKNILVQIKTILTIQNLNFLYLIFDKAIGNINCEYCTPLLSSTHGLCYDECPLGYRIKSDQYQCVLDCNLSCSACTNSMCLVCQEGLPIGIGCTSVVGCTKLISDYQNISNNCMTCNDLSGFKLNPFNNTCTCQVGYTISNLICHNIIGCILPIIQKGQIICRLCNKSKNLQILYDKCICIDGYQFIQNVQECKQVCGDGRVFEDECDDGNVQNGDGCSSKCTIQPLFKCFDGDATSRSKCLLSSNDKTINLMLFRIGKLQGQNAGLFIFKFTPMINLINKDAINNLTFSSIGIQSLTWILVNDQLQITVNYNQSLQNKNASLNFSITNVFINPLNLGLQFTIKSNDIQLLYMSNQQNTNILKISLSLISWIILILFVIFQLFHKMAGVQLIHTYQLIFLIFMLEKKMTVYYQTFKYFSYVNLNFMFYLNDNNNFNLNNLAIAYNRDNQIFTLQIISSVIFTVLFFFFTIIILQKNNYKSQFCYKVKQKLYKNILFPFAMASIIQISFVIKEVTYLNTYVDNFMLTLASLFAYMVIVVVIFNQWKLLIINKSQRTLNEGLVGLSKCHLKYLSIYISFYFLTLSQMIITHHLQLGYSRQILLAILIIFLIIFIKNMPYQQNFHNIMQIFNLTLLIIFLLLSIFKSYVSVQQQLFIVFCFNVIVFIHIIVNVLRIIICLRNIYEGNIQKNQLNKNKQLNKLQKKAFQQNLSYLKKEIQQSHPFQSFLRHRQLDHNDERHKFYKAYLQSQSQY